MATSTTPIELDDADSSSILTSHKTGETPTDPFNNEAPEIRALMAAKAKAEYQEALGRIPRAHRKRIGSQWYVIYDYYRQRNEKKRSWYWNTDQGEELLKVSEGLIYILPLLFDI